MSVENAIDKAKEILESGLPAQITALNEGQDNNAPAPQIYLVGNYLGREELLHTLPAITLDARNTGSKKSQEAWEEMDQEFYVWAIVAEVNIENLHRYIMRYGEGIRAVMKKMDNWSSGWHNPRITNTLYTGVFEAGHRLVQGCRVECSIGEFKED